jgi:primary-amine oxidase
MINVQTSPRTRWLAAGVLAAVGLSAPAAHAACTNGPEVVVTSVSRTFTSHSNWNFIVIRKQCEGLVIDSAYFQPAGGTVRKVLARGNIAEIQTVSLTGTPRNLDVTANSEGLGDTNTSGTSYAATLSTVECDGPGPNGTSLFDGNRVCVMNDDGGHRYRGGNSEDTGEFRIAERVTVLMSSQVGKENYINRWEFNDDGTIEVAFGVTGQVPFTKSSTSYNAYGSRLDNSSNTTPRIGLAHLHNVYYRLDFDIGGAGDDVVSKNIWSPSLKAPIPPAAGATDPCADTGACGQISSVPMTTEAEQSWSATQQTTWTVSDNVLTNDDGRHIGYELVPEIQGIWRGMTGTTGESWTGSELWVTKYNGCELLAARNATPGLPSTCGTPKANVHSMVNGESLAGQDVVVWYANRMLHDVRDEDETNMAIRWTRFALAPRSFVFQNPNEPPPPPSP